MTGMELPFLTGDALNHDFRVPVDEDTHLFSPRKFRIARLGIFTAEAQRTQRYFLFLLCC
jgi:hypothetical protein